jgi:hypothetical protein
VDSWGKRRKGVEVCAEAWGVCAIYMQLGLAKDPLKFGIRSFPPARCLTGT